MAVVWLALSSFTLSCGHPNTDAFALDKIFFFFLKSQQPILKCFQIPTCEILEALLLSLLFYFLFLRPSGFEIILWHFAGTVITRRYQSCVAKNVFHTPFDV